MARERRFGEEEALAQLATRSAQDVELRAALHTFRDDDGRPLWHMHLADHPSNATAGYAAIAAMGLAFHLTEYGVDRLGLCEAAPCRNAYLDTSTNRSRRYCSDRCATRANVAAYRARKRLEADRTENTGRAAPDTQRSSAHGESRPSGRGR